MGVPQNGWYLVDYGMGIPKCSLQWKIMEHPINMDDLGLPAIRKLPKAGLGILPAALVTQVHCALFQQVEHKEKMFLTPTNSL